MVIIDVRARNCNYNYDLCGARQKLSLLNMDMRRSRPYYEYKSSFWPRAEIIMIIVVRARNYNCNYNLCGARQQL